MNCFRLGLYFRFWFCAIVHDLLIFVGSLYFNIIYPLRLFRYYYTIFLKLQGSVS
nr:MAG TPA: hypothetical protein [Caudoviricetes sp.]